MTVAALDHVLVLTDDIDAARDFYREALGLEPGERPPLPFSGHWLYAGEAPCLHVADRAEYHEHRARTGLPPAAGGADTVDHTAFVATDYAEAAARLERAGVAAVSNVVAGANMRQLFFSAPDGVRIEVNVKEEDRG
jgi:catechol 2,3-dioxygenase-like lactoylglutathione lyase family enzyme